jgi:uncharacterized protein YecE (DUF72 family)
VLNRIHRRIRIGCSGWQYQHWRGNFYPDGLPQSRWFAHYAETFDTVEINNSFYRLPSAETFSKWRGQAPPGFVYSAKASRFLTHLKKLKDPADPLVRFFENAKALGPALGAVLYQLPPNFGLNLDRLAAFADAIPEAVRTTGFPKRTRHVIEFRDQTWYNDRVFALLERHHVALCLHDMHGSSTERVVVGPAIYVRFHFGTSKYGGRYEDRRVEDWAGWLASRARDGLDVFAYFNNDIGGHAPRDAVRLRARIHQRLGTAAS